MKKVGLAVQCDIVNDYYLGMKYKDIGWKYGVSRWNIQDALSKFDMKTDRIKSPPRLQGGKKKGTWIDSYNRGEYLPPIKPKKNNPVLIDDLDIMERMDECDDTGDSEFESGGYCDIVIDENDEVRYEKR